MNGSDYIAVRRLSTKADKTLADVGETCGRVPDASVSRLVDSGKIDRHLGGMTAPKAAELVTGESDLGRLHRYLEQERSGKHRKRVTDAIDARITDRTETADD